MVNPPRGGGFPSSYTSLHPFFLFLFLQEIGGEIFGPQANWRSVSLCKNPTIDANLTTFINTFGGDAQQHKQFHCLQNGMSFLPYTIRHTANAQDSNVKPNLLSLATLTVNEKDLEERPPRILHLDNYYASKVEEEDLLLLAYLFKADKITHNEVRRIFVADKLSVTKIFDRIDSNHQNSITGYN
jgi:hypothetical protein